MDVRNVLRLDLSPQPIGSLNRKNGPGQSLARTVRCRQFSALTGFETARYKPVTFYVAQYAPAHLHWFHLSPMHQDGGLFPNKCAGERLIHHPAIHI